MTSSSILFLSGFDPTSGAGIISDSLTAYDLSVYPVAIPSLLTSQNSIRFDSALSVATQYIIKSFELLKDEFNLKTAKVGLLPVEDEKWLSTIKKKIIDQMNRVIIDPVLKATAGGYDSKISGKFIDIISGKHVTITPNRRELEKLYSAIFKNRNRSISEMGLDIHEKIGSSLVVKFEQEEGRVIVISNGKISEIEFDLITLKRDIHGTGCRFSTALACHLEKGLSPIEATEKSIKYMGRKIAHRINFSEKGQDYLF